MQYQLQPPINMPETGSQCALSATECDVCVLTGTIFLLFTEQSSRPGHLLSKIHAQF